MWSIGTARVGADRSTVLDLVTQDRGMAGRTRHRYPRRHPDYAFIPRHIRGAGQGGPGPPSRLSAGAGA